VESSADGTGELGEATLDRHVDVLVITTEREASAGQFGRDGVEAAEEFLAVRRDDDPAGREHPGMGARLGDVVGPEAAIEREGRVHPLEVRMLWLVEATHAPPV
jgi:hypothetical protein